MAKGFWPGFSWRILAHRKKHAESFAVYSPPREQPSGYPGTRLDLTGPWEFDELVIDDWFHLEQMDARDWWLGVGNGEDYWHVRIHIDRHGKARVSMEKQ